MSSKRDETPSETPDETHARSSHRVTVSPIQGERGEPGRVMASECEVVPHPALRTVPLPTHEPVAVEDVLVQTGWFGAGDLIPQKVLIEAATASELLGPQDFARTLRWLLTSDEYEAKRRRGRPEVFVMRDLPESNRLRKRLEPDAAPTFDAEDVAKLQRLLRGEP